jgi:hypothetical protein
MNILDAILQQLKYLTAWQVVQTTLLLAVAIALWSE